MEKSNYNPPGTIANTYQIIGKIGSGGGGVVYLAQHLRLNKKVVLKADKRDVSAKPEMLRREVDALKDMSHTYIPQVYDFIVDGGMAYTVMDYIEGESLDKPLKRGERFSQIQVIEWACQLLEALVYLHSRPPHGILHADIKPANVMVTPQGDVRLIDFNIALALGAEGAVAVGRSFGYASPEHYGVSFSLKGTKTASQADMATDLSDESISYVRTVLDNSIDQESGTSSGKKILLDVRSDVYSLGATLYHLFTGIRPARDAREIMPIPPGMGVSQTVADIIRKAMMPDPDDRYQTAAEMLYAFEHLREADYRTKRYKTVRNVVAAFLAAAFLAGGGITFTGLRQMEQAQARAAQEAQAAEEAARQAEEAERLEKEEEQRAKQALADVRGAEEAYNRGNLPGAARLAVKALSVDSLYSAQAQKVLTDALGVYDLSDGLKPYLTAELPSEALKLEISPEGTRTAVFCAYEITILDTETGETLTVLPGEALVTRIFERGKHQYHLIATEGGGSTVYGWVDFSDIAGTQEGGTPPAVEGRIVNGARVMVKAGAKTYTGGSLAGFVYKITYTVISIKGDRVVIGLNGVTTAAMNVNDLILVS